MDKIFKSKYGNCIDLSIIQMVAKKYNKIAGKGNYITALATVEGRESPLIIAIDTFEAYNDLIQAWTEYKEHETKSAIELYKSVNKNKNQ